jgi:hypothetical protein
MSDATWAHISDQQDRRWTAQPVVLGGPNSRLTSLAFCSRYNRDAHYADIRDLAGVLHWATQKQMRIFGIVTRIGTLGSGYTKTRDIAAEARCSPGYVSKVLLKFEAWGIIGIIRTRGRYGKLFMFAREIGDGLDSLVAGARRRLLAFKVTRAARKLRRATNVSSYPTNGRKEENLPSLFSMVMEETLDVDALTPFARAVLHERARLAMDDPKGEQEAVAPLSEERAHFLFNVTFPPPREQRDSVTVHDWDEKLAVALGIDTTQVRGRVACPAHGEGRAKTISWRWDETKLLVHCFAGCTFDEIRKAALG